jgi:hypothetical protein
VFHREVQESLEANNRELVNCFGARRTFFNRWGDELFKEAYAHMKQSVVTGLTQRAGRKIIAQASYVRMLVENHDSLLMELPVWRVCQTIPIIKESFEQELDFSRCSLPRDKIVIPCELKWSLTSWAEMKGMEELHELEKVAN